MMLRRLILVGLHKVLLTLLPKRHFTLMNEMSRFNPLCPFTIPFPTLMHTGNFDFPAFFLLPLAFRIKSINFNEDNILFWWGRLFRNHFCIQKLLAYRLMANHGIT